MIGRHWSAGKLCQTLPEARGSTASHDGRWCGPKKVAKLCRSFGSRPEAGSVDGGNGGQDGIAGTSTELGGSAVRDERAWSEVCVQKLAEEDRSSAATTSRDRRLNPILRGREAREEES